MATAAWIPPSTFNPKPNGTVWAIALDSSGKPIVGGIFTTVNGTSRNSIARLDTNGALDPNFDPGLGMDNRVEAIIPDSSSKLLVGGAFSKVNNITRNRIARLNTDGSLANTTFNPGVVINNRIRAIALYPQATSSTPPTPDSTV